MAENIPYPWNRPMMIVSWFFHVSFNFLATALFAITARADERGGTKTMVLVYDILSASITGYCLLVVFLEILLYKRKRLQPLEFLVLKCVTAGSWLVLLMIHLARNYPNKATAHGDDDNSKDNGNSNIRVIPHRARRQVGLHEPAPGGNKDNYDPTTAHGLSSRDKRLGLCTILIVLLISFGNLIYASAVYHNSRREKRNQRRTGTHERPRVTRTTYSSAGWPHNSIIQETARRQQEQDLRRQHQPIELASEPPWRIPDYR
ncbi:MAG: hypothetical protein M1825_006201 [Sarcosagium campestre]|nr:MAG: hypothetical protein M1825_006201 [Sarcosagium campestre]